MKKLIFILAFIALSVGVKAQTCQWAEKIGGYSDEWIVSSAVDSYNNLFIAGLFSSDTIFFNNEISLINNNIENSVHNIFIAKYNSNGEMYLGKKYLWS